MLCLDNGTLIAEHSYNFIYTTEVRRMEFWFCLQLVPSPFFYSSRFNYRDRSSIFHQRSCLAATVIPISTSDQRIVCERIALHVQNTTVQFHKNTMFPFCFSRLFLLPNFPINKAFDEPRNNWVSRHFRKIFSVNSEIVELLDWKQYIFEMLTLSQFCLHLLAWF